MYTACHYTKFLHLLTESYKIYNKIVNKGATTMESWSMGDLGEVLAGIGVLLAGVGVLLWGISKQEFPSSRR